jgi:DNA adenine methylase
MDLGELFAEFDDPVRETYIRAPFGWPGGKWNSLSNLFQIMKDRYPKAKRLVDACGGSGVVSINAPSHYESVIFNDRHAGVVAFYRCLRDPEKLDQLVERLQLFLHSREEFIWCKSTWENCTDDVERAARWYYMVKMSFSYLGRNFARAVLGPNSLAAKYHNSLDEFPTIHTRLRRALIENQDVLQCIRDFDDPDTDHYIDPDYIGADTGIYKHRVDHEKLLDTIFSLRGRVFLSGYRNPLYDARTWDDCFEWKVKVTIESQAFRESNNLAGKEQQMNRTKMATEVLWIKEPN